MKLNLSSPKKRVRADSESSSQRELKQQKEAFEKYVATLPMTQQKKAIKEWTES